MSCHVMRRDGRTRLVAILLCYCLGRWKLTARVPAHRVLKEEIFASGMLAMAWHRQLPNVITEIEE